MSIQTEVNETMRTIFQRALFKENSELRNRRNGLATMLARGDPPTLIEDMKKLIAQQEKDVQFLVDQYEKEIMSIKG